MTILANNLREITQQVLAQVNDSIVDLLRSHAKTILAEALEIEVNDVISKLRQSGRDVVRNGYLPERSITSPIGKIEVNVPRIRSKEGERVNFNSTLIPKYLRKSKSIDTWAAYAYLKGISENDIPDVLSKILGQEAKNLGHVSSFKTKKVMDKRI